MKVDCGFMSDDKYFAQVLEQELARMELARLTPDLEIQKSIFNTRTYYLINILATNTNLHSEIQIMIFQQQKNKEEHHLRLALNSSLIPDLLPKLFLQFQKDILLRLEKGFYYQNPATQELLEKYMLLM